MECILQGKSMLKRSLLCVLVCLCSSFLQVSTLPSQSIGDGIFQSFHNSSRGTMLNVLAFETRQADVATLRKQAYTAQNCYRKHTKAQPLQTNAKLQTFAQNYAQQIAKSGSFEHSDGPYGENLFGSTNLKKGCDVIKAWFNEYKDFNFNKPAFSTKAGHYSQLVWKASKTTGIGIATGGGWTYVVAEYDPPGNSGGYASNVGKPDTGNPTDCAC